LIRSHGSIIVRPELPLDRRFLNRVVAKTEVKKEDFFWVLQVNSAQLGQLHLDVRGHNAFTPRGPVDLLIHLFEMGLAPALQAIQDAELFHVGDRIVLGAFELVQLSKLSREVLFYCGQVLLDQLQLFGITIHMLRVSLGDRLEVGGHVLEELQGLCLRVVGIDESVPVKANGLAGHQVEGLPLPVVLHHAERKVVCHLGPEGKVG